MNITDVYLESVKEQARSVIGTVKDDASLAIALEVKRVVRSTRTTGVKIFKYAREEINKAHEENMAKQHAFEDSLAEVEEPLDLEIKTYKDAEAKKLMDIEMEKKLPHRKMILEGLKIEWPDEEFKMLSDAEFMEKVQVRRQADLDAQALAQKEEQDRARIEKETLAKARAGIRIQTMEAIGFMFSQVSQYFIYQNMMVTDVIRVTMEEISPLDDDEFAASVEAWKGQINAIKTKIEEAKLAKATEQANADAVAAVKKAQEEAALAVKNAQIAADNKIRQAAIDAENAKKAEETAAANKKAAEAAAETKRLADLAKAEAAKGDKQKLEDMVASITISYPVVKTAEAQAIVARAQQCINGTKTDLTNRIAAL